MKDLIFFPNGLIGAFDSNGEQMGEIQAQGWMSLYFDFLESKGIDPSKVNIEAQLNGGVWRKVNPTKRDDGSWAVGFSYRTR